MSLRLALLAAAMLSASGLPGLVVRRRPWTTALATVLAVLGSALGLTASIETLALGGVEELVAKWSLPGGSLALRLDPLAAAFLAPLFLIVGLGSIYGIGYFGDGEHPDAAPRLRFFYGLLAGAMAMVFLARNGVLFLVAWELMAVAAFFLVIVEDRDHATREAGWIYLIATHAGTLCLIVLFTILSPEGGVLAPRPFPSIALPILAFALAFVGFGLKAGVVPLHFWLPGAHAHAPSHVSALLSGVMLKAGLYGILRVATLLPQLPAVVAYTVVGLGAFTAVIGILLAIGQRDLKRVLAYSSVENVGIALLGIGLALLGRSRGVASWQVMGLSAAIFHIWNHALFKPLLFFGAGAVLHATGSRDLERMGGLSRTMPRTAKVLALGAATAAALPPSGAFASEWLLYLGFLDVLRAGGADAAVALAVPALALTGALAAACFVRLYATIFLGEPRSEAPVRAHDPVAWMGIPMMVLAALSLLMGLVPEVVSVPLQHVCQEWTGSPSAAAPTFASLRLLSFSGAALLALVALATAALRGLTLARSAPGRRQAVTWDCGYAAPSPRMQYTARSLGEWWTERLAPRFLRPRVTLPDLAATFPSASRLSVETIEPFGDGLYAPILVRWSERFAGLRRIQQGRLTAYLLYVFLTVVALLAWSALSGTILGHAR